MKRFSSLLILCFAFLQFSNSQNIISNSDFEANGGSLDNWGTASGTELRTNGSDHYAYLAGENGVLYQKVDGIVPGKIYECNIYIGSVFVKQTTGYGFAIEKGSTLILPTFAKGSSDLKPFCENNDGVWTTLADSYNATNVVKSFSIVAQSEATAIYVCIGTKGALSKYEIDSVTLTEVEAKSISFLVKDKAVDIPLADAKISFEHLSNPFITNSNGIVTVSLTKRTEPYAFTVNRDWYKSYVSDITVGDTTTSFTVLLDSIEEVKKVITRISKYGDNATPYPLYGHLWNDNISYTATRIKQITDAFDYIIGGGGVQNSKSITDKLHEADPNFQVIKYQGGWTLNANEGESNRNKLQYYRCGNLGVNINDTQTSFTVNKPSDNRGLGLLASETGKFTTWIRIEDELLKIIAVSSTTTYPITITVERGFDGTQAVAHTSGKTVTAPLYSTAPIPGGNNSGLKYFATIFNWREQSIKDEALSFARDYNIDGVWIDILVGWLDAKSMLGGNYTLWDHSDETTMDNETVIALTKDAVQNMYNDFYAQMGYFPVIYGNNVLYDNNFKSSSRGYMMQKTTEHTKVLDGFCHENSWGHMSDSPDNIDNDGEPVVSSDKFIALGNNDRYLEWYMGNTWIDRCKTIALLAQRKLPNQPMTINAGFKNKWFADDLSDEIRYNFNKYAYASYLMSVDVTPDSLISCRMGISPMVKNGNNYNIQVDSFFYRPIGVPTETNAYANFTNYRYGSQNLYSRTFSNGIVLLNPFQTDMPISIELSSISGTDTIYVDPENGNEVITSVQLKSRESLILLKSDNQNVAIQKPKAAANMIKLYPVPAKDVLHMNVDGSSILNGSYKVNIYTNGSMQKSTWVDFNNGKAQLTISDLSSGIYLFKIEGFEGVGRLVKY